MGGPSLDNSWRESEGVVSVGRGEILKFYLRLWTMIIYLLLNDVLKISKVRFFQQPIRRIRGLKNNCKSYLIRFFNNVNMLLVDKNFTFLNEYRQLRSLHMERLWKIWYWWINAVWKGRTHFMRRIRGWRRGLLFQSFLRFCFLYIFEINFYINKNIL